MHQYGVHLVSTRKAQHWRCSFFLFWVLVQEWQPRGLSLQPFLKTCLDARCSFWTLLVLLVYCYVTLTCCMHMHLLSNRGTRATGAEPEPLAVYNVSRITNFAWDRCRSIRLLRLAACEFDRRQSLTCLHAAQPAQSAEATLADPPSRIIRNASMKLTRTCHVL